VILALQKPFLVVGREVVMAERRNSDRRNKNQDYLLSDREVATMAGVPVNTVCYWRLAGILPFVKVGRHPRVWLSEFQRIFHKPKQNGPWELLSESDKIKDASGIRRKR
jgi:hypothetical protein